MRSAACDGERASDGVACAERRHARSWPAQRPTMASVALGADARHSLRPPLAVRVNRTVPMSEPNSDSWGVGWCGAALTHP